MRVVDHFRSMRFVPMTEGRKVQLHILQVCQQLTKHIHRPRALDISNVHAGKVLVCNPEREPLLLVEVAAKLAPDKSSYHPKIVIGASAQTSPGQVVAHGG